MNITKNQKLVYAISAVVLIAFVVYLLMSWSFIKNLFYIVELNEHPAVLKLSLLTAGEVTDKGSDWFAITVAGEDLVVYINEDTIFVASSGIQDIRNAGIYEDTDVELGDTVYVNGFINEGNYWASNITLDK